ncbi:MAG: NADH-quinone oxidoreductase subunit C [Actinomycetota bacterium]
METTWLGTGEWPERARALKEDGWWLVDLAGLDTLGLEGLEQRFEIVVHLVHRERKERASFHIATDEEPPVIPSVVDVWPAANFMEREAFDMFGIVFDGHPNLTRILMPDEWEGYPLRKDYGLGKVPVEFTPQPFLQIESPGQAPSSHDARTEVDALGQSVSAHGDADE